MSQIIQAANEKSYRARMDRRITQGRVTSLNTVTHTCVIDVGVYDVTGAAVPLLDVPYQPHNPPQVGDTITLGYTNVSPHSLVVAGSQVGGSTTGTITSAGAVSTLAASGQPKLQGEVVLGASTGISLTQSGQTITIASTTASITPATTFTAIASVGTAGTSLSYARADHVHPGVHSLMITGESWDYTKHGGDLEIVAGANITLTRDVVNPKKVTIASAGGGVTGVHASGSAAITGDVTLAAGTNVTLGQSGSTVTINSSGGGGGALSVYANGTLIGSESVLKLTAVNEGVISATDSGGAINVQFNFTATDWTIGTGGYGANLARILFQSANPTLPNAAVTGECIVWYRNTAGSALTVSPYTGTTINGSNSIAVGGSALFVFDTVSTWYRM